MQHLKISKDVRALLRCPICKSRLTLSNELVVCTNTSNAHSFPIVDGVPILLNEASSIFSIDDLVSRRGAHIYPPQNRIRLALMRLIPSISKRIKAKENYLKLARLLSENSPSKALVVGSGDIGGGIDSLISNPSVELVETDVAFGPRTVLICDAHDIPFDDESFDAVIAQAVLEHVVDPYRCVEEIRRVLKKHGLVYAETPFMAQVHFGRYDFTRFTYLGHRRLFRRFNEIDSGASSGPGMALAWSYRYFLMSFTTSTPLRALLWAFSGFTSFYLKYFDHLLIDKKGALDAAAVYYFMGRKEDNTLSDRELINLYRGAQR